MDKKKITESTQFLTFKLGDEIFALEISTVREVLEFTTVTRVPQTPKDMQGVINLRGHVVPVIDMRLKFGMSEAEKTVNTCVIITEVTIDEEITLLGAMVDSVQEVMELEPDQIEPPPRIGTLLNTEFIQGMGKRDDQFIIILNVNRIFSTEELAIAKDSQDLAEAVDSAV
ncbi:MAG: chemotaxis protein CheW [SAR324 cluster bacterium]|nr:chemotaxis protein CheW [SAR324 cluster bacterium]